MFCALAARANGNGKGHLAACSKGKGQPDRGQPKVTKYVQKRSCGSLAMTLAAALAADPPPNKRQKTCRAWGESAAIGAISKPQQGVKPLGPGRRKRGPQPCSPCDSGLPAKKRQTTCRAGGLSAAIGAISKLGQGVKPLGRGKGKGGPQLCSPCDPGSVVEGDLEHLQRHKAEGQASNCLRCLYLSDPRALGQYSKLPLPNGRVETWLEPRPRYKAGCWGLGCRICAW
jgi:hypothetical protein